MPQPSIATLFTTLTRSISASELRLLMMHALNKTRVELITHEHAVLTEAEVHAIQQLVQRRVQGEPIAYLTGCREFFGLPFYVTADVLIPRPETELLVELSLRLAPPDSSLLDLGTGSGAIAVAIAHQRSDIKVCATDISPAALTVARRNAKRHGCVIEFVESDWYHVLPAQQWNLIVSNPPYIVQSDPHLSQGDLRFEPINALTDHADGLSAMRQIIQGASQHLTSNGWLLIEHGYDQAQAVRTLLNEQGFIHVQSWCDLAGIERVSGAQLGRH